jgi:hypothetical protein
MNVRMLALFAAVMMAIVRPASTAGQIAAIEQSAVTTPAWTAPRAPDGHPDLEGMWVNRSATPLERPEKLKDRPFLTNAEVAELKKRADRIFKEGRSDFAPGDDVFLAALADVERYRNPNATEFTSDDLIELKEFDNRTSLITDPPDGKLPPYTPAGLKRRDAGLAAGRAQDPAGPEDLTSIQRCIAWGIPMLRSGPYTSYYQIAQTADYVVILMEAIHDARVIPLDGRPHVAENIRAWDGNPVGHWEGETLVVDTTNFSASDNFMGSAEGLHLVERFTRVAADELRYEITITDPATWTKPWATMLRLKQSQEKMYEFACQEGNFATMESILTAARAKEKAAEQANRVK